MIWKRHTKPPLPVKKKNAKTLPLLTAILVNTDRIKINFENMSLM
jgi:hypothetical protein